MSRKCFVCGKYPRVGNTVSHSNMKTKAVWAPNLQKVRIMFSGKRMREYVCTKCLKAGKIVKAV